jgi:signal transduction histidine kinase
LLDAGDVFGSLQAIAARLNPEGVLTIDFHSEGEARHLSDVVAHTLLRIGQEALSNALAHANARRVAVILRFAQESVSLSIQDDGCGFEPGQASGPEAGHFGLEGMRSRAKRLGGQLDLTSKPEGGVTVTVCLPLSPV